MTETSMTETGDETISRRFRILPEQWERIEKAAAGTLFTPNRMPVQLAMEALDRPNGRAPKPRFIFCARRCSPPGPSRRTWKRPGARTGSSD